MYDLGAYPAVIAGQGWSLGELHTIAPEHWPQTMEALDRYEEYDPSDQSNSLYVRASINVVTEAGELDSWIYLLQAPRIRAELDVRFQPVPNQAEFLGQRCYFWQR